MEGVPCQRGLKQNSNTLLDFSLDLRMELSNPRGRFGGVTGTMTLHEPSRPNTAS